MIVQAGIRPFSFDVLLNGRLSGAGFKLEAKGSRGREDKVWPAWLEAHTLSPYSVFKVPGGKDVIEKKPLLQAKRLNYGLLEEFLGFLTRH